MAITAAQLMVKVGADTRDAERGMKQVQQQAKRNRTPDRRAANVDQEIAHLGAAPPSISLTPAAKTPSTARMGRRSTGQRRRTTHILGAPR